MLSVFDQHNDLERNQQVAHIGDIYSEEASVIAWLGCDENIASSLRFVTRLFDETHRMRDAVELWKREQATKNWIRVQQLLLGSRFKVTLMDFLKMVHDHSDRVDSILQLGGCLVIGLEQLC